MRTGRVGLLLWIGRLAPFRPARLIEGGDVVLARNGRLDEPTCPRHLISKSDIAEAMREKNLDGIAALDEIESLHLEPGGQITAVQRRAG